MDVPLPEPAFIGANVKLLADTSDKGFYFENHSEVEAFLMAQSEVGFDIVYAPQIVTKEELSIEVVEALTQRAVELARNSVGRRVKIAGRIVPVGLEEQEEGIGFFDNFSAYFKQARALFEAGVDLFVADAMHSVSDAKAALLACKRFEIPAFITIAVDCEDITDATSYALSSLVCLQEMGADAFGISGIYNCTQMCEMIFELASYARIPLIAKLDGIDESKSAELVRNGVAYIESCVGDVINAKQVCALVKPNKCDCDNVFEDTLVLSNENQAFFLSPDSIEISEYIQCSQDMSDILLDFEDTNIDIIGVELFNSDDAVLFMQNVHMASLPVIFKSSSVTALTTALILYPGRACIDRCCDLSEEVLNSLAKRYGAIIY